MRYSVRIDTPEDMSEISTHEELKVSNLLVKFDNSMGGLRFQVQGLGSGRSRVHGGLRCCSPATRNRIPDTLKDLKLDLPRPNINPLLHWGKYLGHSMFWIL